MLRLDSIIAATTLEPRPYQHKIVKTAIEMYNGEYRDGSGQLEVPVRSIQIESPTGSGKTPMGLLIAKTLQSMYDGMAIAWIAMRHNLLAQAAQQNVEHNICVENLHLVSMFENEPESILRAKAEGRDILLAMDESQHDAANSAAHLHNLLKPRWTLGLSATPFRQDRQKLCFEKVIKDAGIHQLIQDGWLSPYDHYTIPDWQPQTVADRYCAEPERWGKSIFYFVSLSECFDLHKILKRRGVKSDVVTGSTDWESQLSAFRAGETTCLINCMKLTEGFDEPSLHTAWVRPSGRGPTMQMGGRVFRKFSALPAKQIVQSGDTRWPFMRTATPRNQYLWQTSEWRSLTVNPQMDLISQNAIRAIAGAEVEIPKFLRDKQKRRRRVRF